jgi:hypothetical protein
MLFSVIEKVAILEVADLIARGRRSTIRNCRANAEKNSAVNAAVWITLNG